LIERLTRLDDFVPYVSFFFGAGVDLRPVLKDLRLKNRTRKDTIEVLTTFLEDIEKDKRARGFAKEDLEAFAREFCERSGWKAKELFTLLRLAATGRTASPPLFDTLVTLGKDRFRLRLREAIDALKAEADW